MARDHVGHSKIIKWAIKCRNGRLLNPFRCCFDNGIATLSLLFPLIQIQIQWIGAAEERGAAQHNGRRVGRESKKKRRGTNPSAYFHLNENERFAPHYLQWESGAFAPHIIPYVLLGLALLWYCFGRQHYSITPLCPYVALRLLNRPIGLSEHPPPPKQTLQNDKRTHRSSPNLPPSAFPSRPTYNLSCVLFPRRCTQIPDMQTYIKIKIAYQVIK